MRSYRSVEVYIRSFPKEIQVRLEQMREVIRKAAPKAEEGIAYGMPAYKTEGKPLVYFGAAKAHVGFYPTPSAISAFKKELASYKTSKGAVQFPYGEKLPARLIAKIVKFKLGENKKKML